MEMTSERHLPVSREAVWRALNDPAILAECFPGCESMERIGENRYEALILAKVGPVKARFRGTISVEDPRPPESYRLVFAGSGGAAGFAKGHADVRLDEEDGGCRIEYGVSAAVGGKLAQVGSRLVNGAARKLADRFFDNLVARLGGDTERIHTA